MYPQVPLSKNMRSPQKVSCISFHDGKENAVYIRKGFNSIQFYVTCQLCLPLTIELKAKMDLSNTNLPMEMESNKARAQKHFFLSNSLDFIVVSSPAFSHQPFPRRLRIEGCLDAVYSLLPRQHPHYCSR